MGRGTALALMLLLAACRGGDSDQSGIADDPDNWTGYGRTGGMSSYSPLDAIDTGTVKRLGLAWSYDLQPGNSVSEPVEADGTLYTATGYSIVTALDAASGRELWRYDPRVPQVSGSKMIHAWGIRGLAYDRGRVFVGTTDGRLIALDAKSGRQAWSVQTTELHDDRFITGAPRIFDGKLVIGHGGADWGPTRGYVTCYDTATGRQLWRFYTVPGNQADGFENEAMRRAARTWAGRWWEGGGGGTVWNAIAYDRDFNTVLIGVGNGAPWDRKKRSLDRGDNLFLASIVALDADTGAYKWHYQINPGESWDYNAAMDIHLAEFEIGGARRKVLMQAPKNGFFYVIDRSNGRLISAEPFVPTSWASRIDPASGRPVENPRARYRDGESFDLRPGPSGAHSWLPSAFNPGTGLVYIPVNINAYRFSDAQLEPLDGPGLWRSRLLAWNPVTQKPAWSRETPGPYGGGILTTGGGLVFQGRIDNRFIGYDAASGRPLWSFDTKAPVIAPPISFRVRGVQYVTVLTGYGVSGGAWGAANRGHDIDYRTMRRRVLTFALDGAAQLPENPPAEPKVAAPDPGPPPDPAVAMLGHRTFTIYCMLCHGRDALAAGIAPDLRASPAITDRATFEAIVIGGGLLENGMPKFDYLKPADVERIRTYLRSRARESLPPSASVAP